MKVNILKQKEKREEELNKIEHTDDEDLYTYIKDKASNTISYLKEKYYSIHDKGDFDSIVDESILDTLNDKSNKESLEHLVKSACNTLENNLKNKLKYYHSSKRDDSNTVSITEESVNYLSDNRSKQEIEEVEITLAFKQELDNDIKRESTNKTAMRYLQLIMSTNEKLSDSDAARILGVDRETIARVKERLKKVAINVFEEME